MGRENRNSIKNTMQYNLDVNYNNWIYSINSVSMVQIKGWTISTHIYIIK